MDIIGNDRGLPSSGKTTLGISREEDRQCLHLPLSSPLVCHSPSTISLSSCPASPTIYISPIPCTLAKPRNLTRRIIQGTPFPPKTSTSPSSLINYLAPGPETLFDPETDEPSLTGLWDELAGVGIENTGSGSMPGNGDGDDAEKKRSVRTKGDGQRDRTVDKENSGVMGKEKGMILLVGFSELIYQGFSPEYLARFGRALLGWCRQVSLRPSSISPFQLAVKVEEHFDQRLTSHDHSETDSDVPDNHPPHTLTPKRLFSR
jgi:hypothetical protein